MEEGRESSPRVLKVVVPLSPPDVSRRLSPQAVARINERRIRQEKARAPLGRRLAIAGGAVAAVAAILKGANFVSEFFKEPEYGWFVDTLFIPKNTTFRSQPEVDPVNSALYVVVDANFHSELTIINAEVVRGRGDPSGERRMAPLARHYADERLDLLWGEAWVKFKYNDRWVYVNLGNCRDQDPKANRNLQVEFGARGKDEAGRPTLKTDKGLVILNTTPAVG